MKPYGKKKSKSKLGIHNSDNCGCELCNTLGWKISKSRERHNNEEIDDFLTSKEITQNDELEITIQVYQDEDDLFRSCSNKFDLHVVALDPDEAMDKLANKIYWQYEDH